MSFIFSMGSATGEWNPWIGIAKETPEFGNLKWQNVYSDVQGVLLQRRFLGLKQKTVLQGFPNVYRNATVF